MFHVLTVSCFIRTYGDGFRSLSRAECELALGGDEVGSGRKAADPSNLLAGGRHDGDESVHDEIEVSPAVDGHAVARQRAEVHRGVHDAAVGRDLMTLDSAAVRFG